MKRRNWFLIKVIYDIISQEIVEYVDIKDCGLAMNANIGFRKAIHVILKRVFLPVVTTPVIGEYSMLLDIENEDGEIEQHAYYAEDFDEKTLLNIARAVYEATWTPAYKTFDEYLAWEEEKYKNIF